MTTRITVAILLITWTIIIVCFSAAYLTARESLLTMLDDTLTARAFAALDYHLHPLGATETLLPPGDTYVIHDSRGVVDKESSTDRPTVYEPVVTHRWFETRADGKRYRAITVGLIPAGAKPILEPGATTITWSRPSKQFEDLADYLIMVLSSLGMFCGLATGWVALKVSRTALKPLTNTADVIAAIDEKNLSQRIDEQKLPVELVPMTHRLNEMLERLERVFTQRKQFLADAAHELRTPTAALLTTLEVSLRRQRDHKSLQGTIESALTDAKLLRRLVDKLMEQARSDHALERPVFEELDVAALLKSCLATVEPVATEKQVTLSADYPAEIPFNTQRDRLQSVVLNLLTNAIEYNHAQGSVELHCSQDDAGIIISIRDTGQGISAEALPHVFEPFYRADRQKQGDTEHLGLGLFLVQSHIKALGGKCAIESAKDHGTTVRVTLPAIQAPPPQAPIEAKAPTLAGRD
jgi:signal transduction histidine kinase